MRPYARRIEAQRYVKRFTLVCCIAAAAAVAVTLTRFALPLEFSLAKALLTALGVLALGALILPFFPMKAPDMAVEIDRLGFQERVQTAWALREDDSVFATLQRQDTEAALGRGDPKSLIPIRPARRSLAIAGGGLLLCCVLSILPTPHDRILEERAETRRVMAEQAQRIEDNLDALAKDDSLSAAQRAALNERLQKLARQLRQESDYKEGIKEMSRMQGELSEIKKQRAKENAAALQDALSRQPETKALAEDMEGKSPQETRETMEKAVSDAWEKAGENGEGDTETAKALSQALAQAAKSAAAGQTQLGDGLKGLSDALAELDEQALAEALEQLQDALDENSETSSLSQLSGDLKLSKSRMSRLSQASSAGDASQLSNEQNGLESQPGQESQSGQRQNPGNSHSGGQGTGKGQGKGQGQSQDGSQGSGSGNGDGSGSGSGSGQDSGSGQGSGNGAGQGAGAGSGALVESEEIYDDRRLNTDGNQVDIQGDLNLDGPRSQADTNAGEGNLDGYLPYKQVVEEYADSAVSAARREQLPPAVQGWVTEYFDALRE